ncbi:MAG TPA: hypothetical protein PLJ47_02975 [Candidatus Hydrogenedentes bacterium]|nr:hypothetical protein [Candidatus Hydrogenedentota bacterium]
MLLGIFAASGSVFALLLLWTAMNRVRDLSAARDGNGSECPEGQRCWYCNCGRAGSTTINGANGGPV